MNGENYSKLSSIKIKDEVYTISYLNHEDFKKKLLETDEDKEWVDTHIFQGACLAYHKLILINDVNVRFDELLYHECMHALHHEYTGHPTINYGEEEMVRLETAKRHDMNKIYIQIYGCNN